MVHSKQTAGLGHAPNLREKTQPASCTMSLRTTRASSRRVFGLRRVERLLMLDTSPARQARHLCTRIGHRARLVRRTLRRTRERPSDHPRGTSRSHRSRGTSCAGSARREARAAGRVGQGQERKLAQVERRGCVRALRGSCPARLQLDRKRLGRSRRPPLRWERCPELRERGCQLLLRPSQLADHAGPLLFSWRWPGEPSSGITARRFCSLLA